MAYCSTERQLRSVCTTTLATLRWTKSSPGARPTISLAGTRLSDATYPQVIGRLLLLETREEGRIALQHTFGPRGIIPEQVYPASPSDHDGRRTGAA
mgnify:CR=1 FL=1